MLAIWRHCNQFSFTACGLNMLRILLVLQSVQLNYVRAITEVIIQSDSAVQSVNDGSLLNCCNN